MKALRFYISGAVAIGAAGINDSAMACAACTGQSNSAMAHGMNAGILSLLAVIGMVLAGAASFFVFLARRSAAVASKETPKS